MPGYKQQVVEEEALAGATASALTEQASHATGNAAMPHRSADPAPTANGDPHHAVHRDERQRHLAALLDAIEEEVIPRLVLTKRLLPDGHSSPPDATAPARVAVRPEWIIELCDTLLASGPADRFLSARLGEGLTIDQVFRELMAPCARELGARWEQDRANFAEVTLGLGRLQQLLRELGQEYAPECAPSQSCPSVLLAAPPGEQHTFGLLMVAEYFRHDGWEVASLPMASQAELVAAVREEWFAVAGLSAGTTRQLDRLARTIRAMRQVSLNRTLRIMVGGAAFSEHPELVTRVGADAWADDARQAPQRARRLLGLLTTTRSM